MGCAFVYGHRHEKSKHFEFSAIEEGAEARGISIDKLYRKFPEVLKCRQQQKEIDCLTQFEIANCLDLPISFFFHKNILDQKQKIMMCGEGIRPCEFCGHIADFLCDAPIGDGRTCDLPLCREHKYHRPDIGVNIDYCPHHKDIGKVKYTKNEAK